MLKKILAILFGLAFLSFVAMQYNDPDPALWMAIYGLSAVLCFLSAFDKAPHGLLWVAIILCTAGTLYMWPDKYEGLSVGSGDIKNIEEAREALGLLLVAAVFGCFIFLDKYTLRSRKAADQLRKTKWA